MSTPEKAADIGAASSVFLWLTAHALEWIPILQAISLFVAIIAGVLASAFHVKKLIAWVRGRE
jgi:hypothetical protein